jgi:hypothetical protein
LLTDGYRNNFHVFHRVFHGDVEKCIGVANNFPKKGKPPAGGFKLQALNLVQNSAGNFFQ